MKSFCGSGNDKRKLVSGACSKREPNKPTPDRKKYGDSLELHGWLHSCASLCLNRSWIGKNEILMVYFYHCAYCFLSSGVIGSFIQPCFCFLHPNINKENLPAARRLF